MSENELAAEYMGFARAVAHTIMPYDVESESLAGVGLLIAIRTFEEERGVPMRRWVARCVRDRVWNHLRRRRVRRTVWEVRAIEFWDAVSCEDVREEIDITDWDRWLLERKYVLGWADDVIAKRAGISVHEVRKSVRAAVERFQAVCAIDMCTSDH